MCSTALVQADEAGVNSVSGDVLNTTVVFKNLKTQHGTGSLIECLMCPDCQTVNHLGWLFCPKCGKKVDASFVRTMERVDQAPTVVSNVTPFDNPLKTVVAQPVTEPQRAADTAPDHLSPQPESDGVPPQPKQPAIPEILPGQSAKQPAVSVDSAHAAPNREPTPPAPPSQSSTIACQKCGSDNDLEYSYCLTCGASLPVTKTIVMASIGQHSTPRLRLLVKGGGSGLIYEIKDEARIGRTEGTITFPHDSLMSSNHARVLKTGADFILIDEASSNGTFIRIKKETKLEPGDVILVGGQLFRFEA